MDINFILSQTDGRPMYLQIIEQIKKQISLGDWPQGDKLPSIRELAVAIQVSVITVKRAYQELETQGVIFTQQGKGSFVSMDSTLEQQMREADMNDHLSKVLFLAETLGWGVQDITQRLQEIQQQKKDNANEGDQHD